MINDLLKGIAVKLNALFGDGYEIYDNDVTQGLKEPCFFVAVVGPSRKREIGNYWRYINPFVITYFPRTPGDNEELVQVADIMSEGLEFITLLNGDMVMGTYIHYELVDGKVQFFVHYNTRMTKQEDKAMMETMDLSINRKEG